MDSDASNLLLANEEQQLDVSSLRCQKKMESIVGSVNPQHSTNLLLKKSCSGKNLSPMKSPCWRLKSSKSGMKLGNRRSKSRTELAVVHFTQLNQLRIQLKKERTTMRMEVAMQRLQHQQFESERTLGMEEEE